MDLRLLIRGSPTASGISGNLRRVGWQGRQSGAIPITLIRHAMDTAANRSRTGGPSGLYGLVRSMGETGDLLGDELLLVPTPDGFVALWTQYEGGPDGPAPPGDSPL